ncbi:hypothetical protein ABE905_13655 [Enterococcus durans]|uniref:DAPG hydrolase family protein n=1 Tax=Enterococcus durans TaxID=53345 RepID=UPI003D6B740A
MRRVPLYEGAEKKSYYKFLEEIETVPDEEVQRIKALKGDPSVAPKFADRAIIQTEAYEPVPEGVYLMDDGTIFLSSITPCPDITGEMLEWWMIWHQLDPLRYALWNPEDHFNVEISEKDCARFLDEKLPIRERIWGTSSIVTESWNGEDKPTKGELKFVSPDSVGLKNELIGTPKCKAIVVANNSTKIGPIHYPVMMCEYVRENSEGKNEWVVTAWMGHGVKEGRDIKMPLPKPLLKKIASEMPAMFIVHNHKEVGHLNKILPELYADQKSNWLE